MSIESKTTSREARLDGDMPLLLVITPTLGTSQHLDATVESVERLPIAHVHMLVAPAGRLAALARYQDRCVLLAEDEPSKGMYSAINQALRWQGRRWTHFTYINDDDVLAPSQLSHWLRALRGDPSIAQVWYGSVSLLDEHSRTIGRYPVGKLPILNGFLWRCRRNPCTQHGTVITKAALDQYGLFDARYRYVADMDYMLRLQRNACRHEYTGCCVAGFRIRSGQLSANSAKMEAETEAVRCSSGVRDTSRLGSFVGLLLLFVMNPLVYCDLVRRHGWKRREKMFHGS